MMCIYSACTMILLPPGWEIGSRFNRFPTGMILMTMIPAQIPMTIQKGIVCRSIIAQEANGAIVS